MGISLLTMLELNRQGNPWLLNPVPIGAAISPTGVNYSMYATWTIACVPWTVSSAKKTYLESMIWSCLPVLITSTHPCENITPPRPISFHSDPPRRKTQLHTEGKNPMWWNVTIRSPFRALDLLTRQSLHSRGQQVSPMSEWTRVWLCQFSRRQGSSASSATNLGNTVQKKWEL